MQQTTRWAGAAALALLATSLHAQSLDDLKRDSATPGDVLTYGMGYNNQRYSPLKQINTGNAAKLRPVWAYSLNNPQGQESQPIVHNGVMYVTTHNTTVAIDPATGKQIWKQEIELPQDVFKMACCGILNRGAAIYDGKLFRSTLDAHVMAMDAKTGKQLWKSKAADYQNGQAMTSAPLIANGVVLTGIAGGEYGTRGFIDGWDPATGKQLWRFYTTAAPDQKGGDTWPGDTHLKGGAPTWLTGAYDPDLDLVYWGTGNGGPWNPNARKGDNLYIASVVAIRPKTGELVWHYQFSPNDPYDYDATEVGMLVDMKIGGKDRKVLAQANRNGFFYVLDRASGELLAANPYVKVNWAERIDLKTGRPVPTETDKKARAGEDVEIFPSVLGGKNWTPMSWNPSTGLAYANTLNISWPYQLAKPEYKKGEWYLGVNFRGVNMPKNEPHGYLSAIDPMTGKSKWQMAWPGQPSMAGTLSTGGGLVFTGAATGEFIAVDANNGKKLYEFQTSSGIIGLPVTFEHKGKQYVTIVSGAGGVWALMGDERMSQVPAGGSVWTFAVD
ncbi:PQQ-dependent dehydrogenase, methanol/ethanol family [Hydrogenophaga sp. H7]|uniref:PQQ-dependent dehydrogenase, methanol/ethanol family n=1 Tax=Hydrogenophaga sp. H7 TaxID=1882399 RepID=UPI0009A35E46|nr:PQQ-dependent dehydrogenase, methanol/ethanol family [Hydrogenophaga sp. H7]OPF62843.1 quinonprotein alcohol dehydrogenase [Hydrogenophaga sp. H7]